jgi:hypothetical protein
LTSAPNSDESRSSNMLNRFLSHLPLNTIDPVLVVLKGHLLAEELLRDFVHARMLDPSKLLGARLTFSQYLCLAKALSPPGQNEKLWTSTKKLNDLRNKLAHQLEPEEIDKKISNFIQFHSDHRGESPFMDSNMHFGALATSVFAICLAISAAVPVSKS